MPWDFYFEVFRVFFQSSLITFAGQGSLPVLNQEFVQMRHWVTEADVAKSLAVGRLSPGPTGMYVVSLGYMVAGWPGAVLAMFGAMLPPLLVLPIAPLVRRSLHRPWVRGTMQGIGLASAGLLFSVALGILQSSGIGLTPAFGGSVGLAALGFALSWTGKIHPVSVLGAAAAGGALLSLMGV